MSHPLHEVVVDADLVGRLLAAQHPDLAGLPRSVASRGWDNVMVRLGPGLAARLPARAMAAPLAQHEHRWVPELAALVPVAVPAPLRTGGPGQGYPWTWSVVPWLDGTPADQVLPAARDAWAQDLADVLVALHVPAPPDAPANPGRGVPMATRDRAVRQRIDSETGPVARALSDAWAAGLDSPAWTGPAVWLHGDPHPGNLLTATGRLSAVLDFGDLTSGDPASDLAAAWLCFRSSAREQFWARYAARSTFGACELAALQRRARGWAAALVPLLRAHPHEHPGLAAVAEHAEREILADLARPGS